MSKTLKEQLEESFEVAEGVEEDEQEEQQDEESSESEEKELTTEDKGESDNVTSDKNDSEAKSSDDSDEPISSEADLKTEESTPEPVSDETRPPVSWKPSTREHWSGLPQEVKNEVLKREQDIQKGLQQASQHRKVAEEYVRTLQPFQGMIQATGATPSQAIHTMFNTANTLTYGTPKQKAVMVKEIIQNYDVDIQTLDSVLADMDVPDDVNAPLLQAMDKKLEPLSSFVTQFQTLQEQQTTQLAEQTEKELAEFAANNEFYEDVREDMADIMELASKRNRTMTLEQAYAQSCQLNPDIKKILDHREERRRATPSKNELEEKRKASSSLRSTGPTGGEKDRGNLSLRDSISEAFEESETG